MRPVIPFKAPITAHRIMANMVNDEFTPFIIYGPLGFGKSAYAIKVAGHVLGSWLGLDGPCYELYWFKKILGWHPIKVVAQWMMIKDKLPVYIWDDAGYWLYALEFNHPWIKAVCKYMNVVRTDLGGIIFTSPLPTYITRKVRALPDLINIKIMKRYSSKDTKPSHQWARLARAYYHWTLPDMKQTRVRKLYEDKFSCRIPDELYEWYKPLRDRYAKEAKRLIFRELRKMFGKEEVQSVIASDPDLRTFFTNLELSEQNVTTNP